MSTIAVRFLIDREQKRVVFAEAGCDFVDVLFSFLTLPLGTIVRLLDKQSGLGSLDNLYESVERLDPEHLQTEACKEMLLNPRSAAAIHCEHLKIKGIHEPAPRSFFVCGEKECLTQSTLYYTYCSKCLCSRCGKLMGKRLAWVEETLGGGGIFVNDKHNFMITDDLKVMPSSLLVGLSLFKEMQIEDSSTLEEMVIEFGKEEILNLLRRSLVSSKVLTNVCFPEDFVEGNDPFFLPRKNQSFDNVAGKEISLTVVFNKENNTILYAEGGEDFINLLFSFLTFPLGEVFRLLPKNIFLDGCIKNLYKSANNMSLECFRSKFCRKMLLKPKLPTFYGCKKNQVLQLGEITSEKIIVSKGCPKCFLDNGQEPCQYAPCAHGIKQAEIIEWNPKTAKIMADAGEAFVVGSQKYMISDNLHISPLSIISAVGSGMHLPISVMDSKEVSFDNVKVRFLLGVMLISGTVLTDTLFGCSC